MQPVTRKRHDQEPRLRVTQRLGEAGLAAGEVEVVDRPRDVQVTVGVKAIGESHALIVQVAFYLEVGRERERVVVQLLQPATELLAHGDVGQVGDVSDHARHR